MEEEEDVKGLLDEQPLKLAIYDRLTETGTFCVFPWPEGIEHKVSRNRFESNVE